MDGGAAAGRAPYCWLLLSSPSVALPLPLTHPRRRVFLTATCGAATSSRVLPGARRQPQPRPRLEAAQSPPPLTPPWLVAGAVRRDAQTGLAFLLFVLAVVMSSFLSLAIFSFAAQRAMRQLETTAQKLSKVVLQEVPGTLSSLKLSFMEISDLTTQIKSLRQRFMINRFR